MFPEIRHKNNSFHTIQKLPSGNGDMGRGDTCSTSETTNSRAVKGGRARKTKHSLTVPLFISALVSWRLRPIHNG